MWNSFFEISQPQQTNKTLENLGVFFGVSSEHWPFDLPSFNETSMVSLGLPNVGECHDSFAGCFACPVCLWYLHVTGDCQILRLHTLAKHLSWKIWSGPDMFGTVKCCSLCWSLVNFPSIFFGKKRWRFHTRNAICRDFDLLHCLVLLGVSGDLTQTTPYKTTYSKRKNHCKKHLGPPKKGGANDCAHRNCRKFCTTIDKITDPKRHPVP